MLPKNKKGFIAGQKQGGCQITSFFSTKYRKVYKVHNAKLIELGKNWL